MFGKIIFTSPGNEEKKNRALAMTYMLIVEIQSKYILGE